VAERLFGIETEYGILARTADGAVIESGAAAMELVAAASRLVPCATSLHGPGFFLANGARVYVDCGGHPELATAEVTTPEAAVAQVGAGERILTRAAAEIQRARGWRVQILRANVDYESGVSYGRHESYLHRTDPALLGRQLLPHIVARVLFGAGGFHPRTKGLAFSLSPRAAFFSAVSSDNSTATRGILHTKNEPLSGNSDRRLHVICPGDTLLCETGIYLNVATTALLVALVEAGQRPGDAVRVRAPLAALRRFASDTACTASVALEGGGHAGAIDIERHYLEQVERSLSAGILPAWAAEACERWRRVLDLLRQGPEAAAGTLDWATKRVVYADHSRQRGFDAAALAFWTNVLRRLHAAMAEAGVESLSCEEALAPESPIRRQVEAIGPELRQCREDWGRLRGFVDLCQELRALDTRWGLPRDGVFDRLDEDGRLAHRVVDRDAIEAAVTQPPRGRASVRGAAIRVAHESGTRRLEAYWNRVHDPDQRRFLDLSDAFAEQADWRPATPVRDRRGSLDLAQEGIEAVSQPREYGPEEAALQCNELAIRLRSLGLAAQAEPLLRRAVALEEEALHPDHPRRPHRLNNLASVLLMQDKREETRLALERAWELQAGRRDLTCARILWLRLALDWVEGRSGQPHLGRLKTLFEEPELPAFENISTTWNIDPVVRSIADRLAPDQLALLQWIAEALNDRGHAYTPASHPRWSESASTALDAEENPRPAARA